MRTSGTVIARVFAAAALMLAERAASAQPEDRRAAAQALFEQGRTLVEAGRFKEACPKLAESQRLDPGIGTSLWLADCYENSGQSASAWAQFKEAAAAAAMAKDPREKLARTRAETLEKKLSRLLIVVSDSAKAAGITVTRDGIVVGTAELGNALPVDPGAHEVTAAAQGYRTWKSSVTVAAGAATATVNIPPLVKVASEDAAKPPPGGDVSTPPPEESSGGTQRVIGLVVASIGLVGAGVGTYFAFDAKSTYDSSNDDRHCVDNHCDPIGTSRRDDAKSEATIATIAIGAGAAAIVIGAVIFFTAPSSRSTVKVNARALTVRF